MNVRESLIYRLVFAVVSAYDESLFKRLLLAFGAYFKSSLLYRLIKKYIYKKPEIYSSGIVRLLNRITAFFGCLCDKLEGPLQGSLVFRLLRKLVDHKEIFMYILAAYPFTDFVIRNTVGILAGSWDELFFVGLTGILIFDFIFNHKGRKYVVSPLNTTILIFLGVMFICWFLISPDRVIGLEGLRAVCEYIFWFFIILKLCDSDIIGKRLCVCLFIVIGLMAVHGIYQYIIAVPMPSSWVDHNEAGVRTRVYSILTSPNVLGDLMTLAAPIGAGLFLEEKNRFKKAVYALGTLCMIAALVFTFSRGAWLGFVGAVLVFVVFYDVRLLIPVCVLGLIVVFAVPEVGNRISYMLSPEYIESSMNGGRLIRWIDGLKVWAYGKYMGVGLGHFGGAVAQNHSMTYLVGYEYMDTFYMDNYYLKTMIETGIVGLAAFVALMYQVFICSVRAVLSSDEYKYLKIGIMSGLFGVILHNLVENIFEVPMASTEFWIFAAVLMSFWYRQSSKQG